MAKKRILYLLSALWLALASCNLPSGEAGTGDTSDLTVEEMQGTLTALAVQPGGAAPFTATFTPSGSTDASTQTPSPTATPCTPIVTANVDANIRFGPGTIYDQIGALLTGQFAQVDGKNSAGTWWYIAKSGLPGGHGWIAGSTVTASCLPASVAVIAAPPTPTPKPVSGTCKDGYVFRLIISSDKVCVPPASKAQADADNAAASSRKSVTVYGPTACKEGFVWREAYAGDVVCVTPATRSQAAADNAAGPARIDIFNIPFCLAGFVWREATAGDLVCVDPAVRTQAAADNAAAASRVAGPDDCISGYVWREAFSGDKVCVTPAVKSQVAADNAAAPSRTNP